MKSDSRVAALDSSPKSMTTHETPRRPTDLADLVACWDFQESAGEDRQSSGPYELPLKEMNSPIARVEDGVLGRYAARIEQGQWFRIKRSDCGELNIHGPDAAVSLLAWLKRDNDRPWQFIAGCWDHTDTRDKRQYAVYTSGAMKTDHATYERTEACHQPHGFVSDAGGATPGKPACFSYATGKTFIEKDRWYAIGFTYDGKGIRVYVNGVLDELPGCSPFPFDGGILNGGPDGADFTIAQRANRWKGYPNTRPDAGGFSGLIGGVAVYRRALTAREISAFHRE